MSRFSPLWIVSGLTMRNTTRADRRSDEPAVFRGPCPSDAGSEEPNFSVLTVYGLLAVLRFTLVRTRCHLSVSLGQWQRLFPGGVTGRLHATKNINKLILGKNNKK